LPLAATDVGGIPEIVAGTDTPLVSAGDDAALANLMRSILHEPEVARERAVRLNAHVQARFTVGRMTADILDFYAAAPAR
jgi:glycosyltransferase involved in cell wall biosynthesis